MDTIYRDRVLSLMRAEVAKLPSGDATIEYSVDSSSFDNDVESAVGYEVCSANVYEHKTAASGAILTIRRGTVEVHIPEGDLDEAEVFVNGEDD